MINKTSDFLPFELNNNDLRNCFQEEYIFHYKAFLPEEKEFLKKNSDFIEKKVEEPRYNDWIWKCYNSTTGEYHFYPSVRQCDIPSSFCESGLWVMQGCKFYKDYVITPLVINDLLILRVYVFSVKNFFGNHKPVNVYEHSRFVYDGKDLYRETREGIKEFFCGKIYSKYYKYILNAQTRNFDLSNRDLYDFCAKHFPWVKDYIDVYYRRYDINIGGRLLDLYRLFALIDINKKGTKINKNVPQNVLFDLNNTHTVSEKIMQAAREAGISWDYVLRKLSPVVDVEVLPSGDICFHGMVDSNMEIERLYIDDKNFYGFSRNFIDGKWYSKAPYYLNMFGSDSCFYNDEPLKNKKTTRKLSRVFKNTVLGKCGFPSKMLFPVHSLYNCKKYLWYEQAVKMDLHHIFIYYKEDSFTAKQSLPELLGISGSLLKYLPKDEFHIEDEHDILWMQEYFARYKDKVFFAKNIGLFFKKYSYDTLKRYYDDFTYDNDMLENFLKAFVKSSTDATLQDYVDYLNMAIELRKEGYDYPMFLKPSEIKFMHRQIIRDYTSFNSLARFHKREEFDKVVKSKNYKKYCYNDEIFSVISPDTPESVVYEGYYLHHCVGQYLDNIADNYSKIYFLRKNSDLNKNYYTIELIEESHGKPYMHQCYGEYDSIDDDKLRKSFIEKWCGEKKIAIKCGY